VLLGYGVDLLEEKGIVVAMIRSCVPEDMPEHPLPPTDPQIVRCDIKFAGWMMRPISENETSVIMMANADPKFSYVPYALLNLVTKHLAFKMFSRLETQAQSITEGSEYDQKMKENPELYGEIEKRLKDFFLRMEQNRGEAEIEEHARDSGEE